ncbi:MAG: glycoside hydrolase family 5 protein [Nitrososphaerota archaeon]|jgi:hypothetical protein|nr:glycoside hydrolase family 5 protein [Nitrososphaerota archaeon]
MNTHSLTETGHSLNLKKYIKPASLFIIVLLAISMVSVVSLTHAQISAATTTATPALHTSGTYILDTNGNSVYLRGMGLAGFAPNLILWGEGATDGWNNQWNSNPTTVMEQTFKTMKDQWHINYIRVFIYPSWYYRDNIAPSQEDPISYGAQTTPISTKAYLHTLIQTADKYGLYVNIVPYMLTPSASSFGGDPYASQGHGWQGLPMEGWDEPARRFLSDAGYSGNELGFWRWFWTDMADTYKGYDNVIFEAWNEPNLGIDNDAIPSGYLQYLQTMYSAIRARGSTNLIMMQWHMGWHPNAWGNDLSWAKQIASAIPDASNLVYTTHLYYYAPTDLTQYWKTDYTGIKAQLQEAIKTMGVSAPLVINEEGSCLARTSNSQRDVTWWSNLLRAQYDLSIGAGAYYWLSDTGLGSVYAGETMLSRGYTSNAMGKAFIDAYKAPTAILTSTPTASPSTDPQPTQTTEPQPTVSDTASAAPLENPAKNIGGGFLYRYWFIFYWPQYNAWFVFRR